MSLSRGSILRRYRNISIRGGILIFQNVCVQQSFSRSNNQYLLHVLSVQSGSQSKIERIWKSNTGTTGQPPSSSHNPKPFSFVLREMGGSCTGGNSSFASCRAEAKRGARTAEFLRGNNMKTKKKSKLVVASGHSVEFCTPSLMFSSQLCLC